LKQLISLQDLVDLSCGLFPRLSRFTERGLGIIRSSASFELRTTMRSLKLFATRASPRPGRVRVEELTELDIALRRGKGVVLWESPFGHPLLGKAALIERGYSLVQVHGPEHGGSMTWVGQHLVKRYHRRLSKRLFDEIIEINYQSLAYLRKVEARLKANRIVCVRAFGLAGQKFLTTPFKGGVAYVPTGIMSLVRRTNSTLLGLFCYTEDGEDHLVLAGLFPLNGSNPADNTGSAIASRYLSRLGQMIDRHPEQWWGMPDRPSTQKSRTILPVGRE
jgi:lauroyl/myristoyl acyltransferase